MTPTTIDALDSAIKMLKHIAAGGTYPAGHFHDQVRRFEGAANEQREREMKDEQLRAALREGHRQRRRA